MWDNSARKRKILVNIVYCSNSESSGSDSCLKSHTVVWVLRFPEEFPQDAVTELGVCAWCVVVLL